MPLVLTMMLGVVLAALGSAMVVGSTTETMIAGAYRDGTALFYAADGAVEFVVDELARSDWRHVLDTGERSAFVEGTPADSESFEGPAGYQVYAYGGFGEMLGRPSTGGDPYIVVWVADLTEPGLDPASSERVVGVLATASALTGARRSIRVTARLTSSDEKVSVERLSWMQE